MSPEFFLGTHQDGWLKHVGVALFVSDSRLRKRKTLPRAAAPWAADSGGFSELKEHGRWTVSPQEYVRRVYRYRDEIGQMRWAAPQDWMCEPAIINGGWHHGLYYAGTHLSVAEHQRRTIINYLELRRLAADLDIIPVVQGWDDDPDQEISSHVRHVDMYWDLARIDLTTVPLVGVGSVCRLQHTDTAGGIFASLHRRGLHRLHGFGVKTQGLAKYGHLLTSADSMAWSRDARWKPPLPGCVGAHKNCANCPTWALRWRAQLLHELTPPEHHDAVEEVAA